MERAGVKHRTHFRRTHLMPLVHGGIVTMTNPDNPRAVNQRYILTRGRHRTVGRSHTQGQGG